MDLLQKTIRKNPALIRAAASLHRSGEIPPDTYVMDLDMIKSNATKIYQEATRVGLECYICAKQFGRNPVIVRAIINIGMKEAMAMDIEGMKALHRHGVPIAHVGHLGQIPNAEFRNVLENVRPKVITVYSLDRAKQISKVAGELGMTQKLLVKVIEDPRLESLASGGGMDEEQAIDLARQLKTLPNVRVVGATSYPAFDFSISNKTHYASGNFKAMMRVISRMENELGLEVEQVNAPGRNCVVTMEPVARNGATHVEPGQSFLGTLPNHAFEDDSPEIPAVVYVTEISHFFSEHAMAFADSYMATATIGSFRNDVKFEHVFACIGSDPDSLLEKGLVLARPQEFWHSDLGWYIYSSVMPPKSHGAKVGDTVVFGFRPQIYRTPKGRIAVVSGVQQNKPRLVGIFDRAGLLLDRRTDDPVGYDKSYAEGLMRDESQNQQAVSMKNVESG